MEQVFMEKFLNNIFFFLYLLFCFFVTIVFNELMETRRHITTSKNGCVAIAGEVQLVIIVFSDNTAELATTMVLIQGA
jgi:hypothetical protein